MRPEASEAERQAAAIASAERSASSSVVCQPETETRIAARALPAGAAEPARALLLHAGDDGVRGRVVVAEAHEHLVEDDVGEDRDARLAAQPVRDPRGQPAVALDQVGDAVAAELAQRGPHRERAGAAGGLRRPVGAVALGGAGHGEVGAGEGERARQRRRVAHDRERAVVGHVEPLVGVERPGVGQLDAGGQVRAAGRGGGPEPERAVDVEPGAVLAADGGDLRERVEGARVHVAGLGADDRGPVAERVAQRGGVHPALVVGRQADRRVAPEPDDAQRVEDRRVRLLVRDHAHGGRADQPARLDVPARVAQHAVPGGGERGDVGHLRARDEPEAGVGGQPEQLEHPAPDGLLGRGGGRRHGVQPGVLVPGGGEPVRRRARRAARRR